MIKNTRLNILKVCFISSFEFIKAISLDSLNTLKSFNMERDCNTAPCVELSETLEGNIRSKGIVASKSTVNLPFK